MKSLLEKIMSILRKEWFLFVMLVTIGLIIFLFSVSRLL